MAWADYYRQTGEYTEEQCQEWINGLLASAGPDGEAGIPPAHKQEDSSNNVEVDSSKVAAIPSPGHAEECRSTQHDASLSGHGDLEEPSHLNSASFGEWGARGIDAPTCGTAGSGLVSERDGLAVEVCHCLSRWCTSRHVRNDPGT